MIKGDQRKHAVQYVTRVFMLAEGSLSGGTYTGCGLRNALNVKMLHQKLNMDLFWGTLIPLPLK